MGGHEFGGKVPAGRAGRGGDLYMIAFGDLSGAARPVKGHFQQLPQLAVGRIQQVIKGAVLL